MKRYIIFLVIFLVLAASITLPGTANAALSCRFEGSTISYHFEGEPGSEFVYSGTRYVVPASGWVELLAKRGAANLAAADGHQLVLDVWPRDQFGTRHVPLPKGMRSVGNGQSRVPSSAATVSDVGFSSFIQGTWR